MFTSNTPSQRRTLRHKISAFSIATAMLSSPACLFRPEPPAAPGNEPVLVPVTDRCIQLLQDQATVDLPFPGGPWNVPAVCLGPFANDYEIANDYAERMYEFASAWNATDSNKKTLESIDAQKGNWMTQFGLNGAENDYSIPIYHTRNGFDQQKNVLICGAVYCLPSNLDNDTKIVQEQMGGNCLDLTQPNCFKPDTPIPWDSSWVHAGSTDGEMIIVDDATGTVWGLWMVDPSGYRCLDRQLEAFLTGQSIEYRICAAAVSVMRDAEGNIASMWEYSGGAQAERGLGIAQLPMIVLPEEVASGVIRHALTIEMFNTMTGPTCSQEQLATLDFKEVIGKVCGYAIAPAGMHEWYDVSNVSRERWGHNACSNTGSSLADPASGETFNEYLTIDKQVPEGMRFRLDITDSQIEQWLDMRALNDTRYEVDGKSGVTNMRDVARVFAVALRDYGWIPGDTTCYGASFNVAGVGYQGSPAAQQWASMGVVDGSSQFLLAGLFSTYKDQIRALETPVNTCVDGTKTIFHCNWKDSEYKFLSGIDWTNLPRSQWPENFSLKPTRTLGIEITPLNN